MQIEIYNFTLDESFFCPQKVCSTRANPRVRIWWSTNISRFYIVKAKEKKKTATGGIGPKKWKRKPKFIHSFIFTFFFISFNQKPKLRALPLSKNLKTERCRQSKIRSSFNSCYRILEIWVSVAKKMKISPNLRSPLFAKRKTKSSAWGPIFTTNFKLDLA